MRVIHWFNSFLFAFVAGVCLKQIYQILTGYIDYQSKTAALIVFSVLVVSLLIMSSINFILGINRFDSGENNE